MEEESPKNTIASTQEAEPDIFKDTGEMATQIYLKKIARIMYAAGDQQTPLKDSVELMYSLISSIVRNLYNDEILTKIVKSQNPMINKKIKAKKMLKFLERVFPVQTCTYFTSVEIKVN